MKAEDVILAMKTSQDGWHSECVMTDRIKVLAEAVRELACMAAGEKDYEHGSDDEKRWVANYQVAEDIINGL